MKLLNNRRKQTLALIFTIVTLLLLIYIGGLFITEEMYEPNFQLKNAAPSLPHPFGTDFLGRDMLMRTWKGLTTSLTVGLASATISACIAMVLGIVSAMWKKADLVISWFVDLFLAVPHLILLILISIALGKGTIGVLIGVALTHWPSLTRIIRAEVLSLKNAPFIENAAKFGQSKWNIGRKHIVPHLLPQFIVGLLVIFPHAILHESSITFLGFGLPPEQPAIGIILAESLKYLTSGYWWLAVLPGIVLILIILLFDALGEQTTKLLNPRKARE